MKPVTRDTTVIVNQEKRIDCRDIATNEYKMIGEMKIVVNALPLESVTVILQSVAEKVVDDTSDMVFLSDNIPMTGVAAIVNSKLKSYESVNLVLYHVVNRKSNVLKQLLVDQSEFKKLLVSKKVRLIVYGHDPYYEFAHDFSSIYPCETKAVAVYGICEIDINFSRCGVHFRPPDLLLGKQDRLYWASGVTGAHLIGDESIEILPIFSNVGAGVRVTSHLPERVVSYYLRSVNVKQQVEATTRLVYDRMLHYRTPLRENDEVFFYPNFTKANYHREIIFGVVTMMPGMPWWVYHYLYGIRERKVPQTVLEKLSMVENEFLWLGEKILTCEGIVVQINNRKKEVPRVIFEGFRYYSDFSLQFLNVRALPALDAFRKEELNGMIMITPIVVGDYQVSCKMVSCGALGLHFHPIKVRKFSSSIDS